MQSERNRLRFFSSCLMLVGAILTACGYADPIFECDYEEQMSAEAQNGTFVATVVLVQCGATSADAAWIMLTPTTRKLDRDRDKVAAFEGKGVRIGWAGDLLEIAHDNLKSFKSEPSLHGVSVRYTEADPHR